MSAVMAVGEPIWLVICVSPEGEYDTLPCKTVEEAQWAAAEYSREVAGGVAEVVSGRVKWAAPGFMQ